MRRVERQNPASLCKGAALFLRRYPVISSKSLLDVVAAALVTFVLFMLGTRTKQVYAYGRRGHRIVNVSHDSKVQKGSTDEVEYPTPVSQMFPRQNRENIPVNTPSPRVKRVQKRMKQLSPSTSSPAGAKKRGRVLVLRNPKKRPTGSAGKSPRPARQPLSAFQPNMPGSPAVPTKLTKKSRVPAAKGTPVSATKPFSPFVDMDIIVMDGDRKISQERRVSNTSVQTNPIGMVAPRKPAEARPSTTRTKVDVIVLTDSEDDEPATKPVKRLGKRSNPIVISSPESDDSSDSAPSYPRYGNNVKDFPRPVFIQPPYQITKSTHTTLTPIPHARTRKLTPIGHGRTNLFRPISPPSPSTSTDFDLSFEFSGLSLTPTATNEASAPPTYLLPLLSECHQTTPHEFSAFIETFPFDPLLNTSQPRSSKYEFRKIGEASYSEVFGIGDIVLKVIPLRDEEPCGKKAVHDDMDTPPPSEAKDVLKEIVVTRAMGDMCDGFVKLLRTYVVRGRYPSLLLSLWDEYNKKKGSESVRPDSFPLSQTYVIIVLPNGGPDLESYNFAQGPKTGWRQACSLFWQVARSLALAEDLVCFEHRDLHWGQILVKNVAEPPAPPARRNGTKISMDHSSHGLSATVIDLGLSRMDSGDGQGVQTHWTPFDEEIFEGQGDYQFDVYRMMRNHIGNSWGEFRPMTNVMWLHYLTLKLLHSKRLKPPSLSRKAPVAPTSAFTERECYECLVEVEKMLEKCVAPCKARPPVQKGRRKTQLPAKIPGVGPQCAQDVLKYAEGRGWVR